jgi:Bifunctional DNA primase/polymerase, N-terminal
MDSMVNALYFAERGFHVFPCNSDKSPKCAQWKPSGLQSHLLNTLKFLNKHPDIWTCYGIAIPPRFMVVDCDLYKTDEALQSYKTFIDSSGPSLFCVETGSGGKHLWYPISDGASYRKQIPEFPGIDFLTVGAYVIGPGSVTDKGLYEYKSGSLPYLEA